MALRNRTGQRLSRFVFTLNNYSDADYEVIKQRLTITAKWAVIGKEVGESGTKHLQGACVLNKQTAFSVVKAMMPQAHIETMRGKPDQSLDYCTKEDTNAWQFGTLPEPGKRRDLDEIAQMVVDGCTLRQIAVERPDAIIKYHRGLTALRNILSTGRRPEAPALMFWFHGATGTNKTRTAFEFGEAKYGRGNVYILPRPDCKFFGTYDGQPVVIFDDFRAKGVVFNHFLTATDVYPMEVDLKHGYANFAPEVIIITSPHDIHGTFATRSAKCPESLDQVTRRFSNGGVYSFPLSASDQLELSRKFGGDATVDIPVQTFQQSPVERTSDRTRRDRLVEPEARRPRLVRQDAIVRQCISCTECHYESGNYCNDCKKQKK